MAGAAMLAASAPPQAAAQSLFRPGSAVIFAQMEAGAYQRGFSSGFKWAPFGTLDAAGFRILAKSYSGIASTPGLTLYKREASSDGYALIGLEGRTPEGHVGIYLGADTWRRIDYIWGKAFRDIDEYGLRIQVEAITNPYGRWSLTTKAAISSASREVWGQAQLAHPLPGPVFAGAYGVSLDLSRLMVGIETEHSARQGYGKRRFGALVSDIAIGRLGLALSAGYQTEDGRKPSAYGRLTVLWRQ
jgi:hypothetical protein